MYYSALYHAIVRDLEAARERCSRSLELNAEQPAAIMLLALIFTADGDLKVTFQATKLYINLLIKSWNRQNYAFHSFHDCCFIYFKISLVFIIIYDIDLVIIFQKYNFYFRALSN